MCVHNEEEKDMAVAEKKIVRSQSEAFSSIRKKFQDQMKQKGYTYNKETQEVEKKGNA